MMHRTISFGEVLWDLFPDYKKPGGSPANLAYHLHILGNDSILISRVGDDENGDDLVSFLNQKGVSTRYIQKDPKQPTGIVDVVFEDNEPAYTIQHPSAWDFIEVDESVISMVNNTDAICFASLSQRNKKSAGSLQKLLLNAQKDCLKVFDLNLRPPFIEKNSIIENIELADVIKLNEHELETVSKWYKTDTLAEDLLKKNSDKTILITLGAKGSAMYTENGFFEEKAYPISGNGDFVGVGDAFLACFTHLKLQKTDDSNILKMANKYAAFVASEQGGMPEIPDDLKLEMSGQL